MFYLSYGCVVIVLHLSCGLSYACLVFVLCSYGTRLVLVLYLSGVCLACLVRVCFVLFCFFGGGPVFLFTALCLYCVCLAFVL